MLNRLGTFNVWKSTKEFLKSILYADDLFCKKKSDVGEHFGLWKTNYKPSNNFSDVKRS